MPDHSMHTVDERLRYLETVDDLSTVPSLAGVMLFTGALVHLMIAKGVITWDEWAAQVAREEQAFPVMAAISRKRVSDAVT